MKKIKLIIPGRLPGLNDYTKACRTSPQVGARMKKKAEGKVKDCILRQLAGVRASTPVRINFLWVEKDSRRDPDNVSAFGRKVILDALVTSGILPDDSGKYIKGFDDQFGVDKNNPRIEVEIREEKQCQE